MSNGVLAVLIAVGMMGLSFAPLATGSSGSNVSPLSCSLSSYTTNTSSDSSAYARANVYTCSPGYSGQAEYEVYHANTGMKWLNPQWTLCGATQDLAYLQSVSNLYWSQLYYGSNTNCKWNSNPSFSANTLYSYSYGTVSGAVTLTVWTWSGVCDAIPPGSYTCTAYTSD
jgi:hypothetical protein